MILGARHTSRHVTSILLPWRLVRFQKYVSTTKSSTTSKSSLLEALYPAAQQLKAIPPWSTKKGKRPRGALTGDKTRVNIVSEKLCDDTLSYIGPSLQRHVGCDLIDINPGVGVWSRKLNDLLKPRSHILMEPDELYGPLLQTLTDKEGVNIVQKSGILWSELNEVLGLLEKQTELRPEETSSPPRNDSLLVTMNLSYYPKKRYQNFESVASLVLYQLISSIRAGSLFQKYGLVRMLIWVNDELKRPLLPRTVRNRRKAAIEAEMACEWITQVAGTRSSGVSGNSAAAPRDSWLDVESSLATARRMVARGIFVPDGRASGLSKEGQALVQDGEVPPHEDAANIRDLRFITEKSRELDSLEKAMAAGEISPKSDELARLKALRLVSKGLDRRVGIAQDLLTDFTALTELYRSAGNQKTEEFLRREQLWRAKSDGLKINDRKFFKFAFDNLHVFHQDPPVLMWDRRTVEPLIVEAKEFFPNVECCLLDIQPKAVSPLLRGAAGDYFDLLLQSMLSSPGDPVVSNLDNVWPGAAEGLLPHCPSLFDPNPAVGGSPVGGHGQLGARVLNEGQWLELQKAFMKWPFKPTYSRMVARHSDDVDSADAEGNNLTPNDML